MEWVAVAESEERREDKRRWSAERRTERKAAGLCVYCGGPVILPTVSTVKRGRGRPRTGYSCDACLAWRRSQRNRPADVGPRPDNLEDALQR